MGNCKKRKLAYIREKNHYRSFGVGKNYFKISDELLDDVDYIKQVIGLSVKDLEKKFKMKFQIIDFKTGLDGEDFIRQMTTVLYTFKKQTT
jgi:hypothetical protein